MSFFQNFAMAGNCGDNAMNSFLNSVNKSTAQNELWQRDFQNFEQQQQNQALANLPPGFEQGFLDPHSVYDNFEEFDEFEKIWDQPRQPPPFFDDFVEVNPILNNFLRDFLHFSSENKLLPPLQLKEGDVQLSNEEVDKIVERSGAIARHFCATQHNYNLMARQLDNLFRSLNINADPRQLLNRQRMGDWEMEFQNFKGPELSEINKFNYDQYDRIWEHHRKQNEQLNEWKDEFMKEQSNEWADEFKKDEDNERAEEEAWFSKFLTPKSVQSDNQWVNEFHSNHQPSGNQWVDDYEDEEFANLTNRVKEIPFEKLQNSKFLQFVDKVKNKEVNLPDLQMKVMEN